MSIITSFYHRLPSGMLMRLPLAPCSEVPRLRRLFQRLGDVLARADSSHSYDSLWSGSADFREAIAAVLELNGLSPWDLTLGEVVSLCVGTAITPPLLAEYNLLTQSLVPTAIAPETTAPPPPPPKKPARKTFAQVFPLFDVSGGLIYPSGVPVLRHSEFEATYLALAKEAQDLQGEWEYKHPAAMLLYGEELRKLAERLVSLFGIAPAALNLHQLAELALAWKDEPGLLPQLAGLVEYDEAPEDDDGTPIPQDCSPVHFLLGNIAQAGPQDWAMLTSFSFEELKSFQQGLCWGESKSEAKKRAKDRLTVFDKHFGKGSGGEGSPVVAQLRKHIGL